MQAVESPKQVAISQELVRLLEEVLEDARRGLIADVAVTYVKVGGGVANCFHFKRNQSATLIGALAMAQRDILDYVYSEAEGEAN